MAGSLHNHIELKTAEILKQRHRINILEQRFLNRSILLQSLKKTGWLGWLRDGHRIDGFSSSIDLLSGLCCFRSILSLRALTADDTRTRYSTHWGERKRLSHSSDQPHFSESHSLLYITSRSFHFRQRPRSGWSSSRTTCSARRGWRASKWGTRSRSR
jgi:hypothetical protein